MFDINKVKTYGVVTMHTFYKEKRNERKHTAGKIGEEPSLLKTITMEEKRVTHEHFSLYNNFIGVLVQQDKVNEMRRGAAKLKK